MRSQLAVVKNLLTFSDSFYSVKDGVSGVPRMMLVHGFTGAGKSTAISWLLNRLGGVGIYVRATSMWTPSSMMRAILTELEVESPKRSSQENLETICNQMVIHNKALFIDEADYLFKSGKLLDAARDIHDLTDLPVILIGMEGIERKLAHNKQLDRRITQRVKFASLDLGDASILADAVCEVEVSDDLVESYHIAAKGSIAMCVTALSEIERYGKKAGLRRVTLDNWGDKPFFGGNR
jgi:DNA transposition AAA+ family ATPase